MSDASPLDDLVNIRLQLRKDIRCALHESGGDPYYQIEDPLTSNFYRLGVREWHFVRQLDGSCSLGDLIERQSDGPDQDRLSAEEAVGLGRWLVQTCLATAVDSTHPLFVRSVGSPSKLPAWINPAFVRIPLGNPDRLLTVTTPWMLWSVSSIAMVAWLVVCVLAVYKIAVQWDRFCEPIGTILAPDNWLHLFVVWIVLKVVHEYFHGLVCKKYGGRVPSFGLMLILFSPVAFVDVTSSWKFRSKWQRIFTAAAGMYSELCIAALAAILWARTDQPLLSQMCHNVVMTASVSTLLFNGNFLMRFDGYYILSDLLGIQNLYTTGQQYVRYLTRRYLLGLETKSPPMSRFGWFIKPYGIAALVWRVCFYIGILVTAATMFRGAGVIISAMIGTVWLVIPGVKFIFYLMRGHGPEQPNRVRCGLIIGALACGCGAISAMPWPGGVIADGIVEYEPLSIVRASADGFLRDWHVAPGESVELGSSLATIENKQTEFELRDVEGRIERAKIEMRVLRDEKKYESLASKARDLKALHDERNDLEINTQSLYVTSPGRGRAIVRDPDSLVDQYIESGEAIVAIGQEDRKAVIVLVSQKDAEYFLHQLNAKAHVRIKGRMNSIVGAQLTKINPRATKTLRHPALAAPNGGPLAVAPKSDSDTEQRSDDFELIEPFFTATVSLTSRESVALRAGELARVRIGSAGETIGAHLWALGDAWLRQRLTPAAR